MAKYSQKFKEQAVTKALSKHSDQTIKNIADELSVGYSTLQKWIKKAKNNTLENPRVDTKTEKSPQNWSAEERIAAIADCNQLTDDQISVYCRENGIYPHHVKQWKSEIMSKSPKNKEDNKQELNKLKLENKRLQKELNRKDKALSETAALLVLSKKCQAIWGEMQEG